LTRPDSIPDGHPRSWIAIGGSAMFGGYDVRTEDCSGNTLTLQRHRYRVAGVSAEVYQQSRPGVGFGGRLTAFGGRDKAAPATVQNDGTFDPARDGARDDRIAGATASATFDGKGVGATLGFGAGQWAYPFDRPIFGAVPSQRIPVAALRVGKLTGFHSELETGTFQPSPAPAPAGRLMFGIGDTLGNRFRFGFEDSGAILLTGRLTSKAGLELEPYVSFGGEDRNGMVGIGLKKRFYRLP
jgi:hypothetical protein